MFITFKMEICSAIFEAYYYILHILKTIQGLLPGTARLLVLEKGEEEEEEKGEGVGGLLLHIVPCSMRWISYPLVLSNCGGGIIFHERVHDSNQSTNFHVVV